MSFVGYVKLGETIQVPFILRNQTYTPVDPDSLAATIFRVYGPTGLLTALGQGVPAWRDEGEVEGASNETPIAITATGHNLDTGLLVTVADVVGNTAANGTWVVTDVDEDTFTLNGSVGGGDYDSGGTWHVTGYLRCEIAATAANGFEAGYPYDVLLEGTVSGFVVAERATFIVV
jgi:hypothetical protein